MKILIKIFISVLVFTACQNAGTQIDETPTRGNIKISVDESYKLIVDAQLYVFESLYKDAKINVQYKPEYDIFSDFFRDSVRAIITNRKLTKAEEKGLNKQSIYPRTTKIAFDAIAFIINRKNPDSLLSYNTIVNIFSGKISEWKQINPKSDCGKIIVVFDNDKSSNVRYVYEKFNLPLKFPEFCRAVSSNDEVINYVEKNKNAMGVISVNWISDRHDSLSLTFLKHITTIAISSRFDPDAVEGYYYKPYQAYIADSSYPFVRDVYIITRETFSGLGTGFASFISGEKGQRIILKSGLVPAQTPVRLIQIKKE